MSDSASASPPSGFLIQTGFEHSGPQLEGDRGGGAIEGTKKHLEAAAAVAESAGEAMRGVFGRLAPNSDSVEFDVSFTGEAGIPMLGKATAGASLKVTLQWSSSAAS